MKEVIAQKSLTEVAAPLNKSVPNLILIERLLDAFHDLEIK